MHRLKTCATINFIAVSPPLDRGGLFLFNVHFDNLIVCEYEKKVGGDYDYYKDKRSPGQAWPSGG